MLSWNPPVGIALYLAVFTPSIKHRENFRQNSLLNKLPKSF